MPYSTEKKSLHHSFTKSNEAPPVSLQRTLTDRIPGLADISLQCSELSLRLPDKTFQRS